jgi:hypothetical protein
MNDTLSSISEVALDPGIALVMAGIVMALATGLIGSLVLFLSTKRDMQRSFRRQRRKTEQTMLGFKDQFLELNQAQAEAFQRQLDQRLPKSHGPAGAAAFPVERRPLQRTLALSQRAQALRGLRSGESHEAIAKRISIPRCEVELLARVDQFLNTRGNEATVQTPAVETGVSLPAAPMATQEPPPQTRRAVAGSGS